VLITAIFVSTMRIGKFRNLYARFVRARKRARIVPADRLLGFSSARDIIRSLFMAQVHVIKIIISSGEAGKGQAKAKIAEN